jgi:hypothetical protein
MEMDSVRQYQPDRWVGTDRHSRVEWLVHDLLPVLDNHQLPEILPPASLSAEDSEFMRSAFSGAVDSERRVGEDEVEAGGRVVSDVVVAVDVPGSPRKVTAIGQTGHCHERC